MPVRASVTARGWARCAAPPSHPRWRCSSACASRRPCGQVTMTWTPCGRSWTRPRCGQGTAAAAGPHLLFCRPPRALFLDLGAFLLVGVALCLAHPVALGWHLGFPLPPPLIFFFPYFAALFFAAASGTGLALALGY